MFPHASKKLGTTVFHFWGEILPILAVLFVVFHPQSWVGLTDMLGCKFSINCHHHGLCQQVKNQRNTKLRFAQ